MSDIALTKSGDILIQNGNLSIVDGVDAITQLLSQELKFFSAEWFLDIDKGIPYFEKILTKNPNPVELDSIFKNKILSTKGILRLNSFDLLFDSALRTLVISFQAVSTEGLVNFNQELGL